MGYAVLMVVQYGLTLHLRQRRAWDPLDLFLHQFAFQNIDSAQTLFESCKSLKGRDQIIDRHKSKYPERALLPYRKKLFEITCFLWTDHSSAIHFHWKSCQRSVFARSLGQGNIVPQSLQDGFVFVEKSQSQNRNFQAFFLLFFEGYLACSLFHRKWKRFRFFLWYLWLTSLGLMLVIVLRNFFLCMIKYVWLV